MMSSDGKAMKKAVVLLSGGIDSSTTLAFAKAEGYELFAISVDYNQRHKKEIESAQLVARALEVGQHLVIHVDLSTIGGSALTTNIEVPKSIIRRQGATEAQIGRNILTESPIHCIANSENIPITYVPARNTIFLSLALGWAEVLGAEDIFIGANSVDYSGYPDCRPEYLRAFENMANLATKASVEGRLRFVIRAPLMTMKKSEIIKKGVDLGLDYSLTWSCYDPQPAAAEVQSYKLDNSGLARTSNSNLIPCGSCESCIIRAEGFRQAGLRDILIKA